MYSQGNSSNHNVSYLNKDESKTLKHSYDRPNDTLNLETKHTGADPQNVGICYLAWQW